MFLTCAHVLFTTSYISAWNTNLNTGHYSYHFVHRSEWGDRNIDTYYHSDSIYNSGCLDTFGYSCILIRYWCWRDIRGPLIIFQYERTIFS